MGRIFMSKETIRVKTVCNKGLRCHCGKVLHTSVSLRQNYRQAVSDYSERVYPWSLAPYQVGDANLSDPFRFSNFSYAELKALHNQLLTSKGVVNNTKVLHRDIYHVNAAPRINSTDWDISNSVYDCRFFQTILSLNPAATRIWLQICNGYLGSNSILKDELDESLEESLVLKNYRETCSLLSATCNRMNEPIPPFIPQNDLLPKERIDR